jgi:hypothetical protein
MKEILIAIFIVFASWFNDLFGQITFQKTYGGLHAQEIHCVKPTNDGGYIFVGVASLTGNGLFEGYIVKTDSAGNQLWTKTYGLPFGDDAYFSVQQTTSDGGYILIGRTFFISGEHRINLTKLDASGNILWTKTYAKGQGYSVQQTADGGFIGVGFAESLLSTDVYLFKTTSNGNLLWSKTYAYNGNFYDYGHEVRQTNDGGYIIAGETQGTGDYDVLLLKTDTSGNLMWAKTIGYGSAETGYSVEQTSDGGYIIAGNYDDVGVINKDIYLIKTDPNGNLSWSKTFDGGYIDEGRSVKQTADGGYIIAGSSFSQDSNSIYAALLKTDVNGNLLWTRSFGEFNLDEGYSVDLTADGGYILGGRTLNFGPGNVNCYLIKTDANGSSGCYAVNHTIFSPLRQDTILNADIIVTSPIIIVDTPILDAGTGGVSIDLCKSLRIDERVEGIFSIYPNPSSGHITVRFINTIDEASIELVNIYGEIIRKTRVKNTSAAIIEIENIPAGIYFAKVFSGHTVNCKKVIVY